MALLRLKLSTFKQEVIHPRIFLPAKRAARTGISRHECQNTPSQIACKAWVLVGLVRDGTSIHSRFRCHVWKLQSCASTVRDTMWPLAAEERHRMFLSRLTNEWPASHRRFQVPCLSYLVIMKVAVSCWKSVSVLVKLLPERAIRARLTASTRCFDDKQYICGHVNP